MIYYFKRRFGCYPLVGVLLFAISVCSGWAGEINLTSDSYDHQYPQWSPDGNWIVYQKYGGGVYHIYKVSSEPGGSETGLAYGYCHSPQWSPDGNWIVYFKGADGQIYKVSSEPGGSEIALTSDSYDHKDPQWSSDIDWIVYQKYDATNHWQIYAKVPEVGGYEAAMTTDGYEHGFPQWSPDGNWIVYQKLDATNHMQIYKVDVTGGEIPLTSDKSNHYCPQWSPDGNWIVCFRIDGQISKVSSVPGGSEIYLACGSCFFSEWSPDGNWIVYQKLDATNHMQIYKVSSEPGGSEIALTSDSYEHRYPQWSSDGNWIVYEKNDATGCNQIYKTKASFEGIMETPASSSGFCVLKIKPTLSLSYKIVIDYSIVREGRVSLRIYDIAGKLVKELVNKKVIPGYYAISWDGSNYEGKKVRSGLYFVRLVSGKFSRAEKVTVIR